MLADTTFSIVKTKGVRVLNFAGLSSVGVWFYIGSGIMRGDDAKSEDFQWQLIAFKELLGIQPAVITVDREQAMLNALAIVFPTSLVTLCLWHVRKAILGKCFPFFNSIANYDAFMQHWMQYENAKTIDEEAHSIATLMDPSTYQGKLFNDGDAASIIDYLYNTWIQPHGRRIVKLYIDGHLHLGIRTTSPIEKQNHIMKVFLKFKPRGFYALVKAIRSLVTYQNKRITHRILYERRKPRIDLKQIAIFKNFRGNVSDYAINMAKAQYLQLNDQQITDEFLKCISPTMGIPGSSY